ncbi:protein toll-like isoform X2 [Galleria mellonella]|uniref:Protein toll-like isoform X2 n=1 Tax=Galleria mellonella TaxID=7137 RepID=A0ABM3MT98_GALME|nr:protein toll-like isoform X2 [Galleria mellonella]
MNMFTFHVLDPFGNTNNSSGFPQCHVSGSRVVVAPASPRAASPRAACRVPRASVCSSHYLNTNYSVGYLQSSSRTVMLLGRCVCVCVCVWAVLCTVAGEYWNTDNYFQRPSRSGAPPPDWPRCRPPPARCRDLHGSVDVAHAYYQYNVDGKSLPLYRTGDEFTLSCKAGVSLHSSSLPSFRSMTTVPVVRFKYCDVPSDSYATRLAQLNITVSRELHIMLYYKQTASFSRAQFEGLAVDLLDINYESKTPGYLSDDWLQPLTNTTRLELTHMVLPPMISSNRVRHLSLNYNTPRGELGDCGRLYELSICELKWERGEAPARWLTDCAQLKVLRMKNVYLFKELGPFLAGLHPLSILEIDQSFLGFNDGDTLKFLGSEVLPSSATTLEKLSLAGNSLGDVCSHDGHDVKLPLQLPVLQHLSLARSGVTRTCESWPRDMPALTHLDLTGDTRGHRLTVHYRDLKWMGARQSRLLLDDIDTIAYNESHYAEIVRANCTEFKVTISISEYIICDCRLYWFARMLAECPRHVRWAAAPACDRRPMLEQPLDHMLCPIQGEEVCAGGCECWWRDAEHSRVVANCSARGLHRLPPLPQLPPLLQLHAARNHIQAIHSHDIPDTLTYIDLRNNNISRVGAAETRRLFSVRGRRVRLAGNPLRCHCDNRPLVRALLTHRHQVDYADLKCDDEKLLSTIIVEDLCALSPTETLVYALSPTVTAFLLVVLAIWFMYYYRMEVRVYLYSRGLCQCCVREEDLDGDREFDAFVSYTHLDEQFVYEQLVPELESGSPSFKLCIHCHCAHTVFGSFGKCLFDINTRHACYLAYCVGTNNWTMM